MLRAAAALLLLVCACQDGTLAAGDAAVRDQLRQEMAVSDLPGGFDAGGGGIPTVHYEKGGRRLVYVNNPEQLRNEDLGDHDRGNKTILTASLGSGGHRAFFEHANLTGLTIGYGIQLENSGAKPLPVAVHGAGYTASLEGGKPFSRMLNDYSFAGAPHTVPPGQVHWILRRDASVAPKQFVSGVVDFTLGDEAVVHVYAYKRFGAIDGTAEYMGYIRRVTSHNKHDEALVYKGVSPHSEAVAANVDFVIDDSTKGVLPVRHQRYQLHKGLWTVPRLAADGWHTNIGPAMNSEAVTRDMISIDTPGWGIIDPVQPSDGRQQYPNFGNWAVVYRLSGSIVNRGSRAREVSVRLTTSGDVVLAHRESDGSWKDLRLLGKKTLTYARVTVPPDGVPVPYQASFVLGGPAYGDLTQSVLLED